MTIREPEHSWWEEWDREDEPSESTVTVAAVHDWDAGHASVADRLAELAVDDELLIVFGAERADRAKWTEQAEWTERAERAGRAGQPDRAEWAGRAEGAEWAGRPAWADRPRAMLAGLRTRLPRHDVVAVGARPDLARLLAHLLDAGSLPVVLTDAGAMRDLTAELASAVRADRVVRVFRTPAGADLYPVWRRPAVACRTALN